MWTQRDQHTSEQMPVSDHKLIIEQHLLRTTNHTHSELSKSPGGSVVPEPPIGVGGIHLRRPNDTCRKKHESPWTDSHESFQYDVQDVMSPPPVPLKLSYPAIPSLVVPSDLDINEPSVTDEPPDVDIQENSLAVSRQFTRDRRPQNS